MTESTHWSEPHDRLAREMPRCRITSRAVVLIMQAQERAPRWRNFWDAVLDAHAQQGRAMIELVSGKKPSSQQPHNPRGNRKPCS